MENVNNSFFEGLYKDIWRATVPEQVTVKEVNFFKDYFSLKPQAKILDMMCGYGRHSLALAREGFLVTAIDNLPAYISEISEVAAKDGLPIKPLTGDLLETDFDEKFDLAICMGNSLNFFPEHDVLCILKKVSENLSVGGSLVINTWSLTEIVAKGVPEKQWSRFDDLILLSDSRYLFQPTRIETTTTILKNMEVVEVKEAIDYVFSVAEFITLLEKSNLKFRINFGIPGRTEFKLGDPRAYLVAEKLA